MASIKAAMKATLMLRRKAFTLLGNETIEKEIEIQREFR